MQLHAQEGPQARDPSLKVTGISQRIEVVSWRTGNTIQHALIPHPEA
jgi:hypothetical protein